MTNFSLQFETRQWEGCFLWETARVFLSSWRLVCLVASQHALQSSVGSCALGMQECICMTNTRFKHIGNWECNKNGSTAAQKFRVFNSGIYMALSRRFFSFKQWLSFEIHTHIREFILQLWSKVWILHIKIKQRNNPIRHTHPL